MFGATAVVVTGVNVAPSRSSRTVSSSFDVVAPLWGARNDSVAVDVGRDPGAAPPAVGPRSMRGTKVAQTTSVAATAIVVHAPHLGSRGNPVPRSRDQPIQPDQMPAKSITRLRDSSAPDAWASSGVTQSPASSTERRRRSR